MFPCHLLARAAWLLPDCSLRLPARGLDGHQAVEASDCTVHHLFRIFFSHHHYHYYPFFFFLIIQSLPFFPSSLPYSTLGVGAVPEGLCGAELPARPKPQQVGHPTSFCLPRGHTGDQRVACGMCALSRERQIL